MKVRVELFDKGLSLKCDEFLIDNEGRLVLRVNDSINKKTVYIANAGVWRSILVEEE
jgi:hypothetical protein